MILFFASDLDAVLKLQVLESKLTAGQVDPEEYMKELETTVERDKKLLEFYTAKGAAVYVNFIKAKIEVYEKELTEMKTQMAEGQE